MGRLGFCFSLFVVIFHQIVYVKQGLFESLEVIVKQDMAGPQNLLSGCGGGGPSCSSG